MVSIICAGSHLTGNGLSEPHANPYDVKRSKQEGVKAGRPTPYIGAPSEVNYFFFAGPDYSVIGSAVFLSSPSSRARTASPKGVIPPVLILGIPVGFFLTS